MPKPSLSRGMLVWMPERTCTPTPPVRRWDGIDIAATVAAIILVPALATLVLAGAWTIMPGWTITFVAVSHVMVGIMTVAMMGQGGRP